MTDESRKEAILHLFEDADDLSEEEVVQMMSWIEDAVLTRSLLSLWEDREVKMTWDGAQVRFANRA